MDRALALTTCHVCTFRFCRNWFKYEDKHTMTSEHNENAPPDGFLRKYLCCYGNPDTGATAHGQTTNAWHRAVAHTCCAGYATR